MGGNNASDARRGLTTTMEPRALDLAAVAEEEERRCWCCGDEDDEERAGLTKRAATIPCPGNTVRFKRGSSQLAAAMQTCSVSVSACVGVGAGLQAGRQGVERSDEIRRTVISACPVQRAV